MRKNEFLGGGLSVGSDHFRLAMDDIVRVLIDREGLTTAWRQILKQLDSGTGLGPKRCDTEVCPKNVVQVFLLCTVIFAFSRYAKAQKVPIKLQTQSSISDNNCGVIDSEEELVRFAVPLSETFAGRKLENFKWVSIRIFEVKRADTSGVPVPKGKLLRPGRSVF